MRTTYFWSAAIALAVCISPVGAQVKPPSEFMAGYSKGYANHAYHVPSEAMAVFTRNKTKLLVLRGVAANKWQQWEEMLGPCFTYRPQFAIKSPSNKKADVYRFRGGIIVAYDNKAFALDWQMVIGWEIAGGYKKLGLPITDTMRFRFAPSPPPETRTTYYYSRSPNGGRFFLKKPPPIMKAAKLSVLRLPYHATARIELTGQN